MTAVLGIDAAWTERNHSGYALVEETGGRWRLTAAAPNLRAFAQACGLGETSQSGFAFALRCAERALGRLPEIVTVDMPLSREPIVGRRESDNAISRKFGGAGCSTHSPSPIRPGEISRQLYREYAGRGYQLKVSTSDEFPLALAEVYPHPALLRLMRAERRLPYKVAKTRKYWPAVSLKDRRDRVMQQLQDIALRLDGIISGVRDAFDLEIRRSRPKQVEDTIDAIVSAWVGIMIAERAAEPFGDSISAIWVPFEFPGKLD